jgi:zinc finger protein BrlA
MVGFSGFPNFNNDSFSSLHSSHRLSVQTPALEMDLSSPVSMNFVVPSQTTFIDNFDIQSPNTPMKPLQFHSPTSNYNLSLDHSPINSMALCLQYEECKSASTTPSRTSTTSSRRSAHQQPVFEATRTSAALQRVQSDSQAVRQTRKRMKRELSCGMMIPSNIRVQHAADKLCLWPGCTAKFKRQEHLKRHEKTHKDDTPEDAFQCRFCGKLFKGGRSDNLKSHVYLHATKKDSKRTKFYPDAMAVYTQMNRKKKSKTEGGIDFEDEVKMEEIPTESRSRVIARY